MTIYFVGTYLIFVRSYDLVWYWALITTLIWESVALVVFLGALALNGFLVWLAIKIGRFVYGWGAAFVRLGVDLINLWKISELDAAVERAKLADVKTLNGRELDALLTEETIKRNGWK